MRTMSSSVTTGTGSEMMAWRISSDTTPWECVLQGGAGFPLGLELGAKGEDQSVPGIKVR